LKSHQLTRKDIDKIKAEIEYRKLELRPELIEAVKVAREQGDLSENFEYYAAKREKNKNESRIRSLERMLKFSVEISEESAGGGAGIGDKIKVKFDADGFTDEYTLVTTVGTDTLNNCISIESPLGRALRGHKPGDSVNVKLENGNAFSVTVIEVSN
jgi:transcription elongation factor GreA